MKRLAILMPGIWSIRNVVDSGVLRSLAQSEVETHLLMQQRPIPSGRQINPGFSLATAIPPLIIPRMRRPWSNYVARFDPVLRSAYNKRHRIRSYPIYRQWFERDYSLTLRFRSKILGILGTLAQPDPIFYALWACTEALYSYTHDLQPIREQLARIDPTMIWSTTCISPLEYPYVLAARDLRIPVVTSILSFDNFTSKGIFPLYDHYLAWNQKMREQILRYYPNVSPEQVTVTGTPQFDFHLWPSLKWTRERTLEEIGLPNDARYFLHATRIHALGPAETDLVARIVRKMRFDRILERYWIVVRVHPLDDPDRWRQALDGLNRVVVSQAQKMKTDEYFWALTLLDDQARLISSITHSEAILNISSTIALDAAILQRPAICIEFSLESDSPRDILYEEHYTEHFSPVITSGGVGVAHSWQELMALMRHAIDVPEQQREARERLVEIECGLVDGHAAERVANKLKQLLEENVR